MRQSILFRNAALALLAVLAASTADARAVTIDWVPVGNPGNNNDPSTGNQYGNVRYDYNIDKFDVTNSQYAEFLNTKDPVGANTLGLWNSNMADAFNGGISLNAGNSAGSKYVLTAGRENHPVNYESWYDAIRFANWLNNGQADGDTETGAYTLLGGTPTPSNGNSISRNAGATVFLPSESEWYKAAYFDPRTTAQGGPPSNSQYWLYGTASTSMPIASGPTGLPNHVNNQSAGSVTDVGAYTGTTSFYGAFDMSGNVLQWNESLFNGRFRGLRGGSFDLNPDALSALVRLHGDPSGLFDDEGFRVVLVPQPIPEPSSLVLAAFGLIGVAAWGWRRRKRIG